MATEKDALKLVALFETKLDNMMAGHCTVGELENLVKAAKVGGKTEIKFLGFKNVSKEGLKYLTILAAPQDPYKGQTGAKTKKGSW